MPPLPVYDDTGAASLGLHVHFVREKKMLALSYKLSASHNATIKLVPKHFLVLRRFRVLLTPPTQ